MKSTRKLPDGGVVPVRGRSGGTPIRKRATADRTVPGRTVLGGRRVGFSRLVVRRLVAVLLVVLGLATLALFAPTAALYFGLALAILSLPAVLPYLLVRAVVAVIDR